MTVLTDAAARTYAYNAGFTGATLDTMVAIAHAESGLDTAAEGPFNPDSHLYPDGTTHASRDRGIIQINDYWWRVYPDACCYDPACAFAAGLVISQSGKNFPLWSTYQSGAYKQYLLPGSGTLVILSNYPYVNQLDGSLNQNFNCVPASFSSAIRYLDRGSTVTPTQLKNAEYGGTYTGGTALRAYINDTTDLARATFGVDCEPFSGDPTVLVPKVHAWLQAGFPVIATIPSAWNNVFPVADRAAGNMSTHVIAFYSEEGGLTAMNPWGAIKHTGTDTYWINRLCMNQVWRVYKESAMPLNITQVSAFFSQNPDGSWTARANGKVIHGGVLAWYQSVNSPPATLPYLGIPLTNEIPLPTPGATVQRFERALVVYDPGHAYDTQPGYGNVYLAKLGDVRLDAWAAQAAQSLADAKTLAAQLQTELDAANTALTKAQSDLAAATALDSTDQTALTQAQADRDAALAAEAAAQAALAPLQAQLAQIQADSAKALALADAIKAFLA